MGDRDIGREILLGLRVMCHLSLADSCVSMPGIRRRKDFLGEKESRVKGKQWLMSVCGSVSDLRQSS